MEHLAERPTWDCRACERPWPCDPAREALAAELGRTELTLYLSGHLDEAARELPGAPAAELYDRFLGWSRQIPVG